MASSSACLDGKLRFTVATETPARAARAGIVSASGCSRNIASAAATILSFVAAAFCSRSGLV